MAGFFVLQTVAVLSFVSSAVAATSQLESLHVKDSYIITLRQSLPEARVEAHLRWVDDTHQTNTLARRDTDLAGLQAVFNVGEFRGYGGDFDEDTINEIRSHPEVVRVERNQIVGLHSTTMLENSTWGLGTMSSRNPGNAEYVFDSTAGEDTWAYVLDTGVNIRHHDFGGRAIKGADCGNVLCLPGGDYNDTLGHGTHVAGIIAGTRYGVAKKANIVDVKIARADNTITVLSTVSALSWAFNDMETKGRTNRSIVNLSIGGQCNKKLDRPHGCPYTPYWGIRGHEAELDVIEMMFQKGVLTVVAAGNDNTDASWVAPAAAPNALTVGAIDRGWREALFSNYGRSVDILAPGVGILSAGNRSDSETRIFGGTSMATPHVTGLALYLKALENITDPGVLTDRILGLASSTSFRQVKRGSPILVANNGILDKRPDEYSGMNSSATSTTVVGSSTGAVPLPTGDDVPGPPINGTYKPPVNGTYGPRPTFDVVPGPPVDVVPTPTADVPRPPINDTYRPPVDDPIGPPTNDTSRPPVDDMPVPPVNGTYRPPINDDYRPPVNGTSEPPIEDSPRPTSDVMPRPPVDVLPTPPIDMFGPPINDTFRTPVVDTPRPTSDVMPEPPVDVIPTPSTDLPRPPIDDTYRPPVDDTIGPPTNDTSRPPTIDMPRPPINDTSGPPMNNSPGPIDYMPTSATDIMPEPSIDNTLPTSADAMPKSPTDDTPRPSTEDMPGSTTDMPGRPTEYMPDSTLSDAPQPTSEVAPRLSMDDMPVPSTDDMPGPPTETTSMPRANDTSTDAPAPYMGTTDAAPEPNYTTTASAYSPSSNTSPEGSESSVNDLPTPVDQYEPTPRPQTNSTTSSTDDNPPSTDGMAYPDSLPSVPTAEAGPSIASPSMMSSSDSQPMASSGNEAATEPTSTTDSTAPTDGPVPFQDVKEADPTPTLFDSPVEAGRNPTEAGRSLFVMASSSSAPTALVESISPSVNVNAALHLANDTRSEIYFSDATSVSNGEPTASWTDAVFDHGYPGPVSTDMEDHATPSSPLSSPTADAGTLTSSEVRSSGYSMVTIVFHDTTSVIPVDDSPESSFDVVSTTSTDSFVSMQSMTYSDSVSSSSDLTLPDAASSTPTSTADSSSYSSLRSLSHARSHRNFGYLTLPRASPASAST
ncbi:putative subtilisin-like protease [Ophiocordyceps camponoti-leonardi (nom. inval.)]|nr:putative subtilisin-like protease [Ophiocordyceps camponoti-leonardi (nom. inval.)]